MARAREKSVIRASDGHDGRPFGCGVYARVLSGLVCFILPCDTHLRQTWHTRTNGKRTTSPSPPRVASFLMDAAETREQCVPLEPAIQRTPAHAEAGGGRALVATHLLEHFDDALAFHFTDVGGQRSWML